MTQMFEDLFEPGHMALGLLQVVLEGLLELRRARRFGHLRKRLDQLFLGVIEVADLIEQEILQVEQNLSVDPSHACSLRAGAALFPCPTLAAGCIDHSGCNDLRQSLSCGMLVAAV